MSKAFPQMVADMRGRLIGNVDYVRVIWLKYNLSRPIISERTDLRYFRVKSEIPIMNFLWIQKANVESIFGREEAK